MGFMKGALTLGDVVFDPRRILYIKSLRSVVCLGLCEAAPLAPVLQVVEEAIKDYKAETLIAIGTIPRVTPLTDLALALGRSVRVQLVADTKDDAVKQEAEAYGFEIHPELVWAKYRFVEALEVGAVELYFVSAIGGPRHSSPSMAGYSIRVGKAGFGGMVLPVFLKGLGQVVLPSICPNAKRLSIFQNSLVRYDALAVGHHRVFPLGKIADLSTVKTFGRIPLAVSTLSGKQRQASSKKSKARSSAHGKPVV